jgi:lauroyl/myristoyl acyltransferase
VRTDAGGCRRRSPERLTRLRRPLFTASDLRFLLELPILWFAAWILPERCWREFCRCGEAFKARFGLFDPASVARSLERALGAAAPVDAAIAVAAGRSECHLQILRSVRPGGWNADIALEGSAHLDAARAGGQGCVLWVAHFCFNSLAVKMVLAASGHPVWHVSRPEHGFSKSRFGIALLNPIRVRAEQRYLAGRIVIDRRSPGGALRAARQVLENGGIVSFTAGAWEGTRPVPVRLLGGHLPLAVGAPGLALLTGAPVLPVFTVRGEGSKIRVVLGAPIDPPASGSRSDRTAVMAQCFADQTMFHVKQFPTEWRDWKNLTFAGEIDATGISPSGPATTTGSVRQPATGE